MWTLGRRGNRSEDPRLPRGRYSAAASRWRRFVDDACPPTCLFPRRSGLLREFFSLACSVLGDEMPRARVYHAHTTGYASLLAAAAARNHGTKFLLTEHNLYVRDTINTLLGRNMALPVTALDWRYFSM